MTLKMLTKMLCVTLATSLVATANIDTAFAAKKKRKNLLEKLFPKAAQRAKQRRARERQRLLGIKKIKRNSKKAAVASAIKKIEGPTYYTYSPEKYGRIATKSMAKAIEKNRIAAQKASAKHLKALSTKGRAHPVLMANLATVEAFHADAQKAVLKLNEESLITIRISVEKKIAKAIEAHYAANPFHLWLDKDHKLTSKTKSVLYALRRAEAYGLEPSHYHIKTIDQLMKQGASQADAATEFELSLTANVLRYMADAKDGVINPNKISGYHDFGKYNRRYEKHLEQITKSETPAKLMFASHPNNLQFKSLKKELSELSSQDDGIELEPIKKGTFIRPGWTNAELPKIIKAISVKGSKTLIETHKDTISGYKGTKKYTKKLAALVSDFQIEQKLSPDAIIGKNTLFKLVHNSPKAQIKRVKLAMERLRWLPVNLGRKHVFINQPAYNASYIVNNNPQLSMRAIVGKQSNQTNFFYDTIETVEVNPYWNVPRSILVNEKLRKLQGDPYYYQRRGFEVIKYGKKKPVDPGSVNWYDEKTTKKYYVRQKPGGSNALGDVKILFPNKHSIYMHDTPSRGLFKRANRALSHGCVRLHKPREMAAAVMGTKVSKMNSLISKGVNKAMRVPKKMPVYVSYFTAWPNAKGEVKYYPDIYGRDKALTKAFQSTDKVRQSALTS